VVKRDLSIDVYREQEKGKEKDKESNKERKKEKRERERERESERVFLPKHFIFSKEP